MDTPTLDDWKKLYDLMEKIKQLAPWDWMGEDDIFGFQMPGTEELGFISVMGTLGEHLSVAVYQGEKGLAGFWHMQELGDKVTAESLFAVPQLQASLENREEITTEDREIMKQLGLKFRGAKAWPQFRSFRPGCFPWHIEKAEAETLICALEQVLDVAPRYKENVELLTPTGDDDDYLMRVQKNGVWEDTTMHIAPYLGEPLHLKMNMAALAQLKKMMPGKAVIEIDMFMSSHPVQENRKERPYFPYTLLVCERSSGMILAVEMLQPLPTLEAMWGEFPGKVVEALAQRMAPKEIMVRDDFNKALLEHVGKELGCKITKSARLTAVDAARKEMSRFF
jgi:hypothetical protein